MLAICMFAVFAQKYLQYFPVVHLTPNCYHSPSQPLRSVLLSPQLALSPPDSAKPVPLSLCTSSHPRSSLSHFPFSHIFVSLSFAYVDWLSQPSFSLIPCSPLSCFSTRLLSQISLPIFIPHLPDVSLGLSFPHCPLLTPGVSSLLFLHCIPFPFQKAVKKLLWHKAFSYVMPSFCFKK